MMTEAFLEPMLTTVISHCEFVSVACALRSVLLKAELKKDNDKTRKTTARLRLRTQTNDSLTSTITGAFKFLHSCEDICDVHKSIHLADQFPPAAL